MFNYDTSHTNLITLLISMSITIGFIFLISPVMNNNKNETINLIKTIVFYVVIYYLISRFIISFLETSPYEIFWPYKEIPSFNYFSNILHEILFSLLYRDNKSFCTS